MRTLKLSWLFALAGAIVIPACGDSKSSLNPTAPSAISSVTVNAEAGLAVDAGESHTTDKGKDKDKDKDKGSGPGNGNGGGNSGPGNGNGGGNSGPGNGNGGGNSGPGNGNPTPPTNPAPTAPVPPVQTKVEIEGLIAAVGVASITVNGQVVLVTADTEIRHGSRHFALSDLRVGDRVHVKATRLTSTGPGATTTIQANEIKLQNRDDDEDDDDDDEDEDDEDDDLAVTVTATDALASETGPNTGTFRLHRDRSNSLVQLPLTVTFTLNGTATNGTDYTTVPLTRTFPAGEDSVDVVITPIVDALVEGPETVVLTLTGVAPFQLGTPATAVIVLSDGTSPAPNPVVTVMASDLTASEAGDPAVFHFTRTGPTTLPLTVTVMIAGTATNGVDYTPLLSSVSFLAGQAGADVTVSPLADTVIDPLETVMITLVDGADYDLGALLTQTATIAITGS